MVYGLIIGFLWLSLRALRRGRRERRARRMAEAVQMARLEAMREREAQRAEAAAVRAQRERERRESAERRELEAERRREAARDLAGWNLDGLRNLRDSYLELLEAIEGELDGLEAPKKRLALLQKKATTAARLQALEERLARAAQTAERIE